MATLDRDDDDLDDVPFGPFRAQEPIAMSNASRDLSLELMTATLRAQATLYRALRDKVAWQEKRIAALEVQALVVQDDTASAWPTVEELR